VGGAQRADAPPARPLTVGGLDPRPTEAGSGQDSDNLAAVLDVVAGATGARGPTHCLGVPVSRRVRGDKRTTAERTPKFCQNLRQCELADDPSA